MNLLNVAWVDVQARLKETDLAIIPVGAVEVYGPHLPQGADGIVSLALAEAAAQELGCLVTPLVPVGWSQSLASFPGTLNVRPESLKMYLQDMAESLIAMGVRRLFFVNGHLGNVAPIQQIAEDLIARHGVKVAQIDLWRFIQPNTKDIWQTDMPYGHAGESMTAFLLYLTPHLVKMERATATPAPKNPFPDVIQHKPYRDYTDSGLLGDGRKGTREQGEAAFKRCKDRLVAFLRQF